MKLTHFVLVIFVIPLFFFFGIATSPKQSVFADVSCPRGVQSCGNSCCPNGDCAYCDCGQPLDYCCGGCGCGCTPPQSCHVVQATATVYTLPFTYTRDCYAGAVTVYTLPFATEYGTYYTLPATFSYYSGSWY